MLTRRHAGGALGLGRRRSSALRGALLRPDVVWFEEMLPSEALAAADAMVRRCDLMLVVGTSAEVYPAAALPSIAKACGAIVIEINPNATALSPTADYV